MQRLGTRGEYITIMLDEELDDAFCGRAALIGTPQRRKIHLKKIQYEVIQRRLRQDRRATSAYLSSRFTGCFRRVDLVCKSISSDMSN